MKKRKREGGGGEGEGRKKGRSSLGDARLHIAEGTLNFRALVLSPGKLDSLVRLLSSVPLVTIV